jgi:serine/threonine protein kinase
MEEIVINNYSKILELGKGAFGIAFKARNNNTNEIVCIKKIETKHDGKFYNHNEEIIEALNIERLDRFKNKYFPKFHQFIYTPSNIYIIMEHIEGFTPLNRVIPLFKDIFTDAHLQKSFKIIVKNILDGVNHMHNLLVDHNDLKPENILINMNNGEIRIIDFGASCYSLDCDILQPNFLVTLKYADREILKLVYQNIKEFKSNIFIKNFIKNRPKIDFHFKEQCDLWSIGCTIYEILVGKCPHDYNNYKGKFLNYISVDYIKTYNYIDDPIKKKINELLTNINGVNLGNLLCIDCQRIISYY